MANMTARFIIIVMLILLFVALAIMFLFSPRRDDDEETSKHKTKKTKEKDMTFTEDQIIPYTLTPRDHVVVSSVKPLVLGLKVATPRNNVRVNFKVYDHITNQLLWTSEVFTLSSPHKDILLTTDINHPPPTVAIHMVSTTSGNVENKLSQLVVDTSGNISDMEDRPLTNQNVIIYPPSHGAKITVSPYLNDLQDGGFPTVTLAIIPEFVGQTVTVQVLAKDVDLTKEEMVILAEGNTIIESELVSLTLKNNMTELGVEGLGKRSGYFDALIQMTITDVRATVLASVVSNKLTIINGIVLESILDQGL